MHITKDLVAASATPLVLGILAEGESYGYAILKQVNELSGGQLEWTDGLLYPLLHRLERLGHVESAWETPTGGRRRKYYRITDQGRAELAEQRRQWATVVDALRGVWNAHTVHQADPGTGMGGGTMTVDSDNDLEGQIAEWRAYMHRRRELHHTDAEELEDHLRSRITELTEAGLRADEAFLIAVKRMGSLDELSREFAREHSERLWKQLVLPGEPDAPAAARSRRELPVMMLCAAAAALAIKVPALFGLDISGDDAGFYVRNLSLFALPALAAYFAWQRRVGVRVIGVLALLFILGAVAANAYPLAADSQTLVLTAIHLPLALWLVVGVAYVGGDWRSDRRRMDFIRFTGEWLIYFVLIGLGGGVLIGLHGRHLRCHRP